MKTNKLVLASIWMLLSLILTACNPAIAAPSASLNVELSEFKFSPTTMAVFAGKETTLNLTNNGAVKHDLVILKQGVEARAPFHIEDHQQDILLRAELDPGKSTSVQFIFPQQGEYNVICTIPGHMEAGMVATLRAVKP